MSQDFFRIERGLELDETVQMLQGAGVPGAAGDTSEAPVGSTYQQNDDGSLWTKITAGVGTDKWQKMASQQYVDNAVGSVLTWQMPVAARDAVATTLPTGAANAPIVVDGVTVTNGQRVLFADIAGGAGANIYTYNQATGTFAAALTPTATSGDATYVSAGTAAGQTYVYNGSTWVLIDQGALDEEGFIRAFVGKSGVGAILPTYTSTFFVANGDSLEAAIGEIDAELGANVNLGHFIGPAYSVNGNIQRLDTEMGANVTLGNHITPANTINQNIQDLDTFAGAPLLVGNFISAGQQLSGAITSIDAELGPNVSTGNFVTSANKINQNIQALDTQIGANVVAGTYVVPTASTNANVQALDTALATTTLQTAVTNVTSVQTIDSVTADGAKWLVRVENAADSTNVYSTEVYAVGNGVSADYTRYATLKIGASIAGLAVTVDFSAGALRLRVASTAAVNVVARRVGVLA